MDCPVIITANGKGTRMVGYIKPKFLLPFKGNTILGHLLKLFPDAKVLASFYNTAYKTNSRKDTLKYYKGEKQNIYVIDCDIYIPSFIPIVHDTDTIYTWKGRNNGIYFIKDLTAFLDRMEGDDMASGMQNPKYIELETIHLGTPGEYEANR